MSPRATIIGVLISASAFAQAHFEVASVKPMNLTGEGSRRELVNVDPGSLTLRNVTLSTALQWAYGIKDYQITGPAWIKDNRYEILAKPPQPPTEEQMRPCFRLCSPSASRSRCITIPRT